MGFCTGGLIEFKNNHAAAASVTVSGFALSQVRQGLWERAAGIVPVSVALDLKPPNWIVLGVPAWSMRTQDLCVDVNVDLKDSVKSRRGTSVFFANP